MRVAPVSMYFQRHAQLTARDLDKPSMCSPSSYSAQRVALPRWSKNSTPETDACPVGSAIRRLLQDVKNYFCQQPARLFGSDGFAIA